VAQLFAAILLVGLALFAIKIAFIFLILAGLIFRTKQTLALVVVLAAWALFWKAPVISCVLIGAAVLVAIYKAGPNKDGPSKPKELPDY
jgi:uncharacterized BrkB/YihY/UPF0761 family membrane protein